MRVQVLVASMNQQDHSLLKKMNIKSDVIVGNQCAFNKIEEFDYNSFNAKFLNFKEKGVGLNRNNALMRATGDICLFADDDMVYFDNYCEIVKKAFIEHPNADAIVFNLEEENSIRRQIKKKTNVNWFNYLRYGTARIAIKLKPIKENAIYFNQCFGGGTEHCHGEDNLFLTSCLKNRLKIIALPLTIAKLTNERESTWNNGFDEKYIKDQGVLYRAISRKWWKLICLQDAIRRRKQYKMSWIKAYKLMKNI